MKMTDQKRVLAIVAAMAACHLANAQPQTLPSPSTSGSSISKESGWSAYSSGGERGGVVQVISDADVQAELNLNNEQQQHVGDILRRVRSVEDELFEDFRRSRQEALDSSRARGAERSKKYQEANQQLARATEKILALLRPAQRTQLQALCRQSRADEAGF